MFADAHFADPTALVMDYPIDSTLPPRYLVEYYRKAYRNVHGREPAIRYMGNHWYSVDGETVHRATLIQETVRLREYYEQMRKPTLRADKSVIQRLIARLRSL